MEPYQHQSRFNKKQIAGVLGLLLLIIAVPVGIYLAQRTQIFRSQASESAESVNFPIASNIVVRSVFNDDLSSNNKFLTTSDGAGNSTAVGTTGSSRYKIRFNDQPEIETDIERTAGEHLLEVIVTDQGSFVKIDNNLVGQGNVSGQKFEVYNNPSHSSSVTASKDGRFSKIDVKGSTAKSWDQSYLDTLANYYQSYNQTDFTPLYNGLGHVEAPFNRTSNNDVRSIFDTATAFYMYGKSTNNSEAIEKAKKLYTDGLNNYPDRNVIESMFRGVTVGTLLYATIIMESDLSDEVKNRAKNIIFQHAQAALSDNPKASGGGVAGAEKNALAADFLASTVNYFPDVPNRNAIEAKARCFAFNSIMRPSDLTDSSNPCFENRVTTVGEDFTLINHGFENPPYYISTLHFLARGAMSYKNTGKTIPAEFTHNYAPLYQKYLTYLDQRNYHYNVYLGDWSGATISAYYAALVMRFMQEVNMSIGINFDDLILKRDIFYNGIVAEWHKSPPTVIDSFVQTDHEHVSYKWLSDTNFAGNTLATALFLFKNPVSVRSSSASSDAPEIIAGSCNQTTLNLSWKEVPGITKYQMRGRKTDDVNYSPTLPNGQPDPNWTSGLNVDTEVLSNGDGSGVSCYGGYFDSQNNYVPGKCAYSFSGLNQDLNFKIWVNAVDNNGKRSANAYVPNLVSCRNQEGGDTSVMAENITASCSNGVLTMKWNVSGGNADQFLYRVRGLLTDDPNYFPPSNWTDGISPNRYVSNGSGGGVACQDNSCTYTQRMLSSGSYRLWVDLKGKDNNFDSKNSYVNGLVNCSAVYTSSDLNILP